MKFQITMKDPDGFTNGIDEAVASSIACGEFNWLLGQEDDDLDEYMTEKAEFFKKACEPWFRHDEYVTIEIDTEAKTCTVVPHGRKS